MTTGSNPGPLRRAFLALAVAGALGVGFIASRPDPSAAQGSDEAEPATEDGGVVFLHALDNQPIEFTLLPDQKITPAVEEFHRTAENPYRGDPEAVAAGQKLFTRWCQSCDLKDATGRIGPSLVDEEVRYPRVATDQGMFEVIYAGAAGAMQAFGQRMDQDEILKVMAFVDSLRGE